jgi:hypothetical protein
MYSKTNGLDETSFASLGISARIHATTYRLHWSPWQHAHLRERTVNCNRRLNYQISFAEIKILRVMSHIPRFGDARKSPAGDVHPPHSHSDLPQETPHLKITGYVTLLDIYVECMYHILLKYNNEVS